MSKFGSTVRTQFSYKLSVGAAVRSLNVLCFANAHAQCTIHNGRAQFTMRNAQFGMQLQSPWPWPMLFQLQLHLVQLQ